MPKQAIFNARIETADTSGAFKDAWRETRCLVPADGFHEWTKNPDDGGRDPWHIHLPDGAGFSFASLWAHNRKLDVTSCTVIAPAAEPMSRLHDRSPVILDPAVYDAWLDPPDAGRRPQGHLDARARRPAAVPSRQPRGELDQGRRSRQHGGTDQPAIE